MTTICGPPTFDGSELPRNILVYFPVKMHTDSVKRAEKDSFDQIPD